MPVTSETRFLLLVISSFHRKEEFLVSLYHRPSFLLVFPFLPHHHLFFAALLRPVRVALFQRDGKMMYNYDDFLAAIEQMSPRHYQRVIVSRFRPHLFFGVFLKASFPYIRHQQLWALLAKGTSASYFFASMHPSHSRRDTVRLMRAVFFSHGSCFSASSSSAIPLRLV